MKVFIYFLVFSGLGAVLGSCASSKVNTDFDSAVNFNTYRTFRFTDADNSEAGGPLYHNSLIDNSIHAQIAIELEKRGILENPGKATMLVAYHTYTEKKRSSINNYYPMMYGGWGWGYYPRGFAPYPYGYWSGYNSTYVYTEGTLIIDAIDARTKQLVWRGSISDVINSPRDLHRKATWAVELIFKKFPVKKGNHGVNDDKPLARKN